MDESLSLLGAEKTAATLPCTTPPGAPTARCVTNSHLRIEGHRQSNARCDRSSPPRRTRRHGAGAGYGTGSAVERVGQSRLLPKARRALARARGGGVGDSYRARGRPAPGNAEMCARTTSVRARSRLLVAPSRIVRQRLHWPGIASSASFGECGCSTQCRFASLRASGGVGAPVKILEARSEEHETRDSSSNATADSICRCDLISFSSMYRGLRHEVCSITRNYEEGQRRHRRLKKKN